MEKLPISIANEDSKTRIRNVLPSESIITIIEWKRKTRERERKRI